MHWRYHLIIPAKPERDFMKKWPGGYKGEYKAGEIKYHVEWLKEYGGVFWYWGHTNSGIKKQHKIFFEDTLRLQFGKKVTIGDDTMEISKIGYFYETKYKKITWEFESECIKLKKELNDFEKEYIPDFRKIYLKGSGSWILIKKLKQLRNPIEPISQESDGSLVFNKFKYYRNESKEFVPFDTNKLIKGNAFVIES